MLRCDNPVGIVATQFSDFVTNKENITQLNENSSELCRVQNCLCIWYHDHNLNKNIQSEMKKRLHKVFTYFRVYNDLCEFAAYLINPLVKNIFLVITSKLAECLCTIAKNRSEYQITIYHFQPNTSSIGNSLVFTDFDTLFIKISEDIKPYLNQNQSISSSTVDSTCVNSRHLYLPLPWSIWSLKTTENSFRCWKKKSPEFFLFQALFRILTKRKCDNDGGNQSLADMIGECRLCYINDPVEGRKIDYVEKCYKPEDAILHYTEDSFLFRLVGKAFRSEDLERIYIFRPYIYDLHWELDKRFEKSQTGGNILQLYRGKKLLVTVLQKLKDNIGNLLSMNGFLSTTRNLELAHKIFAGVGQDRIGYKSVLFEFLIDETTINRTYADITEFSQFPVEEEVLFSIGSIWRIDSVETSDNLCWTVKLSSCNDIDERIVQYFEELPDDPTLMMIGDVLFELEQYIKAENFYLKMFKESTLNDEMRSILYKKIAMINMKQERYSTAIENFTKAETIILEIGIDMDSQTLHSLYSNSIITSQFEIFNNMGLSYEKINESDKALEYLMRAFKLPYDIEPIYKATVCDNIGLIYFKRKQYDKALKYFKQAIALAQGHSSLFDYKQHYESTKKHLHSRAVSLDQQIHISNSE